MVRTPRISCLHPTGPERVSAFPALDLDDARAHIAEKLGCQRARDEPAQIQYAASRERPAGLPVMSLGLHGETVTEPNRLRMLSKAHGATGTASLWEIHVAENVHSLLPPPALREPLSGARKKRTASRRC